MGLLRRWGCANGMIGAASCAKPPGQSAFATTGQPQGASGGDGGIDAPQHASAIIPLEPNPLMLKKLASIGLLQLLGLTISAARSKIFAVLLGPAGFGIVATIDQLVTSLVQLCNLSLPYTALKLLSRSDSQGKASFRRSYGAFFKLVVALAIVSTLAAMAVIPSLLPQLDPHLSPFQGPTTIALAGIGAFMMSIFLVNALAAQQASLQAVMVTVATAAVALVAGVSGYLAGGLRGLYLASVAASTIFVVVAFWCYHRHLGPNRENQNESIFRILLQNKGIVGITFWVYVSVASAAALLVFIRYLAITQINSGAAGFLQACIGVSLSIGAVLGPATFLYFTPHISREMPIAERFRAANDFMPRLLALYCSGAMLVLLFPEITLWILYSAEFSGASLILPWFVAWQGIYQFSNTYQQLLISLDDLRGFGVVAVTGNLIAGLLCLALVSRYQLLGIALGMTGGGIVAGALTLLRLRLSHGLAVPKSSVVLGLFALLAFGVVASVGRLTVELSWPGLAARVATAALFLMGLWTALPAAFQAELATAVSARMHRWFRKP